MTPLDFLGSMLSLMRSIDTARFRYHTLRRELSNFAVLRHRRFTGCIVSMHQSGTHWLKYMLATAMALQWDLPPPAFNHANDFISGPHEPRRYPQLPALASAHSIPHRMLRSKHIWRLAHLPKYLILVRDPRGALVSNFEKWRSRYQMSFGEYLHGDISGRRFNSDIWWCIRFMNAWGDLAARYPEATHLLKYEHLVEAPLAELERVNSFLSLGLATDALEQAVATATREHMLSRHDPLRPAGEVSPAARKLEDWFGPAEERRLREICHGRLRFPCGYDLSLNAATSS